MVLVAMSVGSWASSSLAADDPDAMSKELARLKAQVEELQRRVDMQTQKETSVPNGTSSDARAQAPSDASPPPVQTSGNLPTIGDSFHYKGVTITPGGFVAAEGIYRQHNQENDIWTNFNAIPFENNPAGHASEARFTARQSRLSALMQGDPNEETHLAFFAEFDFQGGAQTANSVESNSYNPRLRHLYASIDWDNLGLHLLAGQTWSLVTLNTAGITPRNELPPPTIDGQYLPGFSWTRQPQVRITKSFAFGLWTAVSLENPQTTSYAGADPFPASVNEVSTAPGGLGFASENALSINRVPDVVGKVADELTVAERSLHLEVFGLYRNFYERLDYHNTSVNGGGVGAGLTFQVVPTYLDVQVSGLVGKGIGRYGSGTLPDVTFDGAGYLHPLDETQLLAGLTVHALPVLDLYIFAGEEREASQSFNVETAGSVTPYGYGNPLYVNAGCFSEASTADCIGNTRLLGQATAGFWYKPYVGDYGTIRYGMQFSRTERQAFAGVGGTPTATQNIVLASFRYYPF
jgi:hypothetical protein